MMMTLTDYRNTKAWQAAIELGPQLVRLAEELPAAEQVGLSMQLRQLMVELPAAIALDLLNEGHTSLAVALRLGAALELIERVYPALDAGPARTAVAGLTERVNTPGHLAELAAGVVPAAVPVVAEPASAQPLVPGAVADLPTEGEAPATPSEAAASLAPAPTATVPVTPAPVPGPVPAANEEAHTVHVQPDSGQ
jgi:hypothetical protein